MADTVASSMEPAVDVAQAILARLCRQPSVAAQGLGMTVMPNVVEAELSAAGFSTRRLTGGDAPPIIFGEQRGRGPFTLLLYNHYDVQPPEPFELWESPPFEPTVRDEKLYARGATDNKGELAARLAAVRALREADGELPITIKWIVEGEEEIGSLHFEELIAPHARLLQADGCLWEGTSRTDNSFTLCLGYKGLLYVELAVACLRQDAHSGMAGIFPSAAWRLVGALGTLRTPDGRVAIPGFYDAVRSPTPEELATFVDQPDIWAQMLARFGLEGFLDGLTGLALWERASFAPTGNIAGLGSGYTGEGMMTVLPAKALAKLDFRLVPNQEPHTIAAALRAHLDAEGYDDVRLKTLAAVEPDQTPLSDPFVQRVAAITASFSGRQPVVTPLGAATLPLLAALRRHVGLPGLSAPTNAGYMGSSAHAPNEHIRLDDLRRAVAFNTYLLQALGAKR